MSHLTGTVRDQSGNPVPGATVHLRGAARLFPPGTLAPPAAYSWTRDVSGISGNRWQVWAQNLNGTIPGLTWHDYVNESLARNPGLADTGYVFQPNRTYILPETSPLESDGVVWTRPLTGFFGNRWQVWSTMLQHDLRNLDWSHFLDEVLRRNPDLEPDGYVFQADKRYWLPENLGQPAYHEAQGTGADGRFQFDPPAAGEYELSVSAYGFHPGVQDLSLGDELDVTVTLALGNRNADVVASGSQLLLKGQPFRFVGMNIRGLIHYGRGELPLSQAGNQNDQLQSASDLGARVIRLFAASTSSPADQVAARLKAGLDNLAQRGLYGILCLTNFYADTPFKVQGDDLFYADNLLTGDWFTGGFRRNYLPFVEYLVQQCAAHPAILAWELGNELSIRTPDSGLRAGLLSFVSEVSDTIRRQDPNHLIATGFINSYHAAPSPDGAYDGDFADALYGLPNVDLVTIHTYGGDDIQFGEQEVARARDRWHKPVVLEEFGTPGSDRTAALQAALDKWFGLGVAGFMQWGFMSTHFDIGDGDERYGMDPGSIKNSQGQSLHRDFDGLAQVYRDHASALV